MKRQMTYGWIYLFMLIAFGAFLRFSGITYDLPYAFNPDEAYIMDKAVEVADGNLRHGIIFRGSLPYYITGFTIRLASVFSPNIRGGYRTYQEAYVQDRTSFYLIGRLIVASYSVATMIVLFFLARALFTQTVGLLSVLIFSLNTLDIQYAYEVYSDTALSFFIVLTVYTLRIAFIHKRHAFFIVSAILIGLAMGQKLPGIILLPFILLVYRAVLVNQHIPVRSQVARYLAIGGIVIVVYLLSYPFIFSELSSIGYKWNEDTRANLDQLVILEVGYFDKIRDYILWLRAGSGTIVLLMTCIGAYRMLRMRAFFTNILLSFTLCFLLFIALGKAHWDNYLLPIIPFLSLFSAYGFTHVLNGISSWTRSQILARAVLVIYTVFLITQSLWFVESYRMTDTRSQEAKWLDDHHVDEASVARDGYTSVAIPPSERLVSKMTKEQLQTYPYIVLSNWYSPNFSDPRRNTPQLAALYTDVMKSYRVVAEFNPLDRAPLTGRSELFLKARLWNRPPPLRGPTITILVTNTN